MNKVPGTYCDYHDESLHKIHRTYALEPTGLYFLTTYLKEDGRFTGEYSFDVEAADDSHYKFTTAEEGSIRAAISARDNESLVEAMVRYLENHSGSQLVSAVSFRCREQYHFY